MAENAPSRIAAGRTDSHTYVRVPVSLPIGPPPSDILPRTSFPRSPSTSGQQKLGHAPERPIAGGCLAEEGWAQAQRANPVGQARQRQAPSFDGRGAGRQHLRLAFWPGQFPPHGKDRKPGLDHQRFAAAWLQAVMGLRLSAIAAPWRPKSNRRRARVHLKDITPAMSRHLSIKSFWYPTFDPCSTAPLYLRTAGVCSSARLTYGRALAALGRMPAAGPDHSMTSSGTHARR